MPEISTDGLKDRFEDVGIEKEGRAEVEPKAVGCQARRAPADLTAALEHRHAQTGLSQEQRGRQAAWPGADDHDSLGLPHSSSPADFRA